MNQPAAPSRATASGTLAYGPLIIPISFYAGVQESSLKREEYVEVSPDTFAKVGRVPAVKLDDGSYGAHVAYADIVKRYATASGELVTLTDEEVADVLDLPSGLAQIVAFQPLSMLDAGHYLPDNVMQVRAKNAKGSKAGDYALGLLFKAMRIESVFALVKYTMRGTMRYGALIANGRFLSLRFDNEVREARPLPVFTGPVQELDMAVNMVSVATTTERIPLVNDAAERVEAYAEAKAIGAIDEDEPVIAVNPAHLAGSLMDTLRAAVASTEKVGATS